VQRPVKVLLLPETQYMLETEHHIPEDGYEHNILSCPCKPEFQREGNKVIVLHMEVVERK
jgi:hypothetical protein